MNSPFKFLDAYTLDDKEVFFGRNKEVEMLYNLLFSTPILLVHGLSGTGKSSLIQCGLASRYEGPEWYPFFIRRQGNINTALRQELQKAIPDQSIGDHLPGFIQKVFETYYSPVYLIFDQFEELFILGTPAERQKFVVDLKAILDAELPCKILLVMREEYLGRLYDFEQKIPYLFDFRLRVEPMTINRVKEVLQQSFSAFNISLEEPAGVRLEEIIENVSGKKSGIELPYLQVYLDLLYKEDYQRTYPGQYRGNDFPPLQFTQAEIADFGLIEDVLEKFLLQQEKQLQEQLNARHTDLPQNTVWLVLDVFVTEEGTKQPVRFQRASDAKEIEVEEKVKAFVPNLSSKALSDCLEALEDSRLLRFFDDTIELAHDKLAALIHEQRSEDQRNLIRARARFKFAREEHLLSGAYLNRNQLEDLEQYLSQLGSEPGIQSFVEANRQHLHELDAAEEERRQHELKLTQEKLETQRRAARRQRVFLALMSLLLLVAIWQSWKALDNLSLAILREGEANEAKQEAENNLKLALAAQKADSLKAIQLEDALGLADSSRQQALEREKEAKRAKQVSEDALNNLKQASEQTVKLLLKDTRQLIQSVKYKEALKKLESAADLKVLEDSVALTFLEVAYFYNETGRQTEAKAMAQKAAGLLSIRQTSADLKTIFNRIAPGVYKKMDLRHYPVMVPVMGGSFTMGCDTLRDHNCDEDEIPPHTVHLNDYNIARTETTVWQFALFCEVKGRNIEDYYYSPSMGLNGKNPVVYVDWYDALEYANWVSVQKGLKPVYTIDSTTIDPNNININAKDKKWTITVDWEANGYRLPTEAEWEYAARGGNRHDISIYSGSNQIDSVGWYTYNSIISGTHQTHPVAGKKSNGLKLFDMSGNVWEWCWDWYEDYPQKELNNPKGPKEEKFQYRVLRGGSWSSNVNGCRVSVRSSDIPDNGSDFLGFRLSRRF